MRVLYLSDRLSLRGGADQHLLQVIADTVASGGTVTVAYGRRDSEVRLPEGARGERIRGLATAVSSGARLDRLRPLLHRADVVHVQNIMNPVALDMAVQTGRALVTVQDHRVFCPGSGKTLPDGSPCSRLMSEEQCAACLPDTAYRHRLLRLTTDRQRALQGARLLVLSRYMADELAAAGLPGAGVLPPWVETSARPVVAGEGFVLGGRLVRHKGVLDGWHAWRLATTDQPLRVTGAGPLEHHLDGAELLGWLPEEELRRLLSRSRALLFPASWQEPFGIMGVLALAEGTAVIVADSGGTGEWSGAGCLHVPAGDRGAMAAAMQRLAGDPELARRLGEQGKAAVAERFARQTIEARLQRIYTEIHTATGVSVSPRSVPRSGQGEAAP